MEDAKKIADLKTGLHGSLKDYAGGENIKYVSEFP
jgi:hypothetical protein